MTVVTARVTYESPEGRVRVERESPREFALYLDGAFIKCYPTQTAAEVAGGVWLHEQAEELAVQLADEAADRDAAREPVTLADIARQYHAQPTPISADPWDDGPEPYADTPMSPERAAAIDSWLKGPPPAPQPFALIIVPDGDDDPEPPPPAAPRVLWRWAGTADALQGLLAARRAA